MTECSFKEVMEKLCDELVEDDERIRGMMGIDGVSFDFYMKEDMIPYKQINLLCVENDICMRSIYFDSVED